MLSLEKNQVCTVTKYHVNFEGTICFKDKLPCVDKPVMVITNAKWRFEALDSFVADRWN